ncbi:MAG: 23S rRNA pseudouridine(2604) synthase RluF [Clostridium sp.]
MKMKKNNTKKRTRNYGERHRSKNSNYDKHSNVISQKITKKGASENASGIIVHDERSEDVRLNKFIGESGYASRREADRLIEAGRVTVDGIVATMGTKVKKGNIVKVDGKNISNNEELVYIVLNKPVGITCTTERNIKGNIVDFIGHKKRIFPIGRLDKDSEGLIFLTNDGDIVNKILRSGNNHDKEYVVTVNKSITKEFIDKMSSGVKILDTTTKKCTVEKLNNKSFKIILTEGLNRQIRRMCEACGYDAISLRRVRIMNVSLDNLKVGQWRYMTTQELKSLNNLIQESKK